MTTFNILKAGAVLQDVMDERLRQERKFPEQELPDGTSAGWRFMRDVARSSVDRAAADGTLTWFDVLEEEVFEAASEDTDQDALRAELIQVAAVAVRWVEAIDRRRASVKSDAKAPHELYAQTGGGEPYLRAMIQQGYVIVDGDVRCGSKAAKPADRSCRCLLEQDHEGPHLCPHGEWTA